MAGGLPAVSSREAVAALERAGFVFVSQRGSHRKYRNLHTGRRCGAHAPHAGDGDSGEHSPPGRPETRGVPGAPALSTHAGWAVEIPPDPLQRDRIPADG
ncbi:MAG: type II toxin-antitoxin system HicA family toxin [Candidatus Dormibacteria bacterium]